MLCNLLEGCQVCLQVYLNRGPWWEAAGRQAIEGRADPVANTGIVAYKVTQTTCGAVVRILETLMGAKDGGDTILFTYSIT